MKVFPLREKPFYSIVYDGKKLYILNALAQVYLCSCATKFKFSPGAFIYISPAKAAKICPTIVENANSNTKNFSCTFRYGEKNALTGCPYHCSISYFSLKERPF